MSRLIPVLFLALSLVAACGDDSSDGNEPGPLPEPQDDSSGEGGSDATVPDAAAEDASPPDAEVPDAPLPPTGVDYATQIQPIFNSYCIHCHGPVVQRKGRRFDSLAGVLTVVTACDCQNSLVYQKTGPNPPAGVRMPADGPPYLTDAEHQLLCDWIDQGAQETFTPDACP